MDHKYFKNECDVISTSIKESFTRGFELGLRKAPAQEQKTGRWIKSESWKNVPTVCSECKHEFTEYVDGYEWEETGDLPNYCPNCGIRMNVEEQDLPSAEPEVPEKEHVSHGKLIDADKFFESLSRKEITFSLYHDGMFVNISDMNDLLRNLPYVENVVDLNDIFHMIKLMCKHHTVSMDRYSNCKMEDACHCQSNIPKGDSWGTCDLEHCPFLKENK